MATSVCNVLSKLMLQFLIVILIIGTVHAQRSYTFQQIIHTTQYSFQSLQQDVFSKFIDLPREQSMFSFYKLLQQPSSSDIGQAREYNLSQPCFNHTMYIVEGLSQHQMWALKSKYILL